MRKRSLLLCSQYILNHKSLQYNTENISLHLFYIPDTFLLMIPKIAAKGTLSAQVYLMRSFSQALLFPPHPTVSLHHHLRSRSFSQSDTVLAGCYITTLRNSGIMFVNIIAMCARTRCEMTKWPVAVALEVLWRDIVYASKLSLSYRIMGGSFEVNEFSWHSW